jgi:hypothetical protein
MTELETSVEWVKDGSQRVVTAEGYPGYRVRIEWSQYSEDALDSQAMSAVVKFDRPTAQLHTGCGDELDLSAIANAWKYFEDGEKLARWLVMTGEAYAVEIVQTPGHNSWGFLVAATPEWVRQIWTPEGETPGPEHIEKAKAALAEEAKTVAQWIEGEVYTVVPEQRVTVAESVTTPAGLVDATSYDEWRDHESYGPVGGFIGDESALAEAKDMLAWMVEEYVQVKGR